MVDSVHRRDKAPGPKISYLTKITLNLPNLDFKYDFIYELIIDEFKVNVLLSGVLIRNLQI